MDISLKAVSHLYAIETFRRGAEKAYWKVYFEPRGVGKVEGR